MRNRLNEKTPGHLRVVGWVSFAWNAFGCYIYSMTMLRDPTMMAATPPEVRAALDSAPVWATAAWALGVWAALAGSLLLMLRKVWAVHAFAVSLVGLAGTAIYEATSGIPVNIPQLAIIWAVALFLLWYAVRMRATGVLR